MSPLTPTLSRPQDHSKGQAPSTGHEPTGQPHQLVPWDKTLLPPLTSVSPSDRRTFDLHPQLSHEAAESSREPRQELGPEGSFTRRTFSFRKKDSAKGLKLGACSETGAIQQLRCWEGGKSPDKMKGQANTPPQCSLSAGWPQAGRTTSLCVRLGLERRVPPAVPWVHPQGDTC